MTDLRRLNVLLVLATCLATGCVTAPGPGGAPRPVSSIDQERLYSGDWHEIAYRPTWLTKGCVAGVTRYDRDPRPHHVRVRDSCRKDSVDGEEKSVVGDGRILDPGANARIRVTYFPFFSRETWIAAVASDYAWFITVTPDFGELNIFARDPQISPEARSALVERAKGLGYDVSKLYFPPQPLR